VLNKPKHATRQNSFVSHSSLGWETQQHIKFKTNGWELKWATHTHRASEHKYATSAENKSHEMRMERNETEAQYQTVSYIHSLFHQAASAPHPSPAAHRLPPHAPHSSFLTQAATTTSLKNPTTVESAGPKGVGRWKRGVGGEDTQPETCRRQKRRSLKTGEQNNNNVNWKRK